VLRIIVTEYDDTGRDDDGSLIPTDVTNGSVAAATATAATNGTSSGKHRREVNKKVNLHIFLNVYYTLILVGCVYRVGGRKQPGS